jgi:membrane protease YdiL (CAAX protease family)
MKKSLFIPILLFVLSVAFLGNFISVTETYVKYFLVILVYFLIFVFYKLINLKLNDLGLEKKNIKNGIKLALPFISSIVFVAVLAYFISSDIFQDERYDTNYISLLIKMFIILPVSTVILEELVFRGMLFGVIKKQLSVYRSAIISSILFGLWHLFSAEYFNGNLLGLELNRTIVSIAIVLATATAGMFFIWLRVKSESLIAPILVHFSLNATGMLLAYLSWQ